MTSFDLSLSDPTLAVAERQLAVLGELAEMSMVAARAFTASAVASAQAAEEILEDKFFMPEVGRAQACGAKDAAESIQKVSRAVRLTLMLEMKVAEIVRDIRAGVVTYASGVTGRKDAGGTPADPAGLQVRQSLPRPSSRGSAGSCSPDSDTDSESDRREADRLEFDRPDTLPRTPFRETVDRICADLGAPVDWSTWTIGRPDLKFAAVQPSLVGDSDCRLGRPPTARPRRVASP